MGLAVNQQQLEDALDALRTHLWPFVEILTNGQMDTLLPWKLLGEHPGIPRREDGLVPVRHRWVAITNEPQLRHLVYANLQGWAVYAFVNAFLPQSLQGVRGAFRKDRIATVRAAAAELDIAKGNAPKGWQSGDLAATSPLWPAGLPQPTMQVESRGGPHFWWVFQQGQDPSVGRVEGINRALGEILPGDPSVWDASRVLRAPGFFHWKTGEPFLVQLVHRDRSKVFAPEQLETALAASGVNPQEVAAPMKRGKDGWVEPWPMTLEQYKRAVHEAAAYVQALGVAKQGSRGSTLYKVVCQRLHDYGLQTDHAMTLLRYWADHKCSTEPSSDYPFSDEHLEDAWARAGAGRKTRRGSVMEEWSAGEIALPMLDVAGEVERMDREARAYSNPSPPRSTAGPSSFSGGQDAEAQPIDVDDETEDSAEPGESAEQPTPPPSTSARQTPPHSEDDPELSEDGKFIKVFVKTMRRKTLHGICKVFAKDPRVYEYRGKLAQIVPSSEGYFIAELTRNSIMTFITDFCQFFRRHKNKDGTFDDDWCDPPTWVAGELLDQGEWPGIKSLKGLSVMPRIRADGSITDKGYDADSQMFYRPEPGMESLKVGHTRQDAETALAFLLDLVADFPFQGLENKAGAIAGMLSPFCRKAQNGFTPMFLIDGNRPNVGKSKLLTMMTYMFGDSVFPMSWAPTERHNTGNHTNVQRVNSAFLAGKTVLSLDNLDGAFGDAVIDGLLTIPKWGERELGRNKLVKAENLMTLFGTANNIRIQADLWRRVVMIRLVDNSEKPRSFRFNVEAHVPQVHKAMTEACLTILRAYCAAGRPCTLTPLGSFEAWTSWVAGALVWLGLPDVTVLVQGKDAAAADTHYMVEREALFTAVEKISAKLDKLTGVTAQELTEELEVDRRDTLGSAYNTITSIITRYYKHPADPLSRADVANLLKRHRDTVANGKVLTTFRDADKRGGNYWRLDAHS